MKKQVSLYVCFRSQGKEKQKIHFTNADTNNENVQMPYYGIWELP